MGNKNNEENPACLYSRTDMLRSSKSFITQDTTDFTFHVLPTIYQTQMNM